MEIIVYYRARSREADGIMRLVFEVSPREWRTGT